MRSYRCDVGVEDEVAELVRRCTAELGPPTVLVNNAGVNANFDLVEMTSDEWDAFFAVDLKAAWLTTKHTVPGMRAAGRGAIVNVSSIHGFTTIDGFFPYAAAKSGLIGLTRTMALELGPDGIRVNAVCPGFTRTRLVQASIDLHADRAAAEAAMVRGVALGRMGEPAELAATIAFLASDDAVLRDRDLAARRRRTHRPPRRLIRDRGMSARRAPPAPDSGAPGACLQMQ